jgi:hypothetical protein
MTDIAIRVENLSKQYRIGGPSTALRTGVGLMDAEGNPIESREAVETPPDGGRWVYMATVAVETGTTVRIAVTATDRPGGVAEAEEEKAIQCGGRATLPFD